MKQVITSFPLALLVLIACNGTPDARTTNNHTTMQKDVSIPFKSGYSEVNGIKMYYEIYGEGKPLVLIHGGGSTIETSFGRVIPQLSKHRQVIAVELQAHGRTNDRDADLSFEQDADDVATLLKNLQIDEADILGFSNGGTTALQIAIRHPQRVGKLILGSALAKRSGTPVQFWDFMKQARLENMPEPLKEAYRKVAPDAKGLQIMHDRDAKRMVNFKDIADEKIKSIEAPTLIIIGDKDVITPEHALEMHRMIPNSQLAIIPGGHGEYIGEIMTLKPNVEDAGFSTSMIENFLGK